MLFLCSGMTNTRTRLCPVKLWETLTTSSTMSSFTSKAAHSHCCRLCQMFNTVFFPCRSLFVLKQRPLVLFLFPGWRWWMWLVSISTRRQILLSGSHLLFSLKAIKQVRSQDKTSLTRSLITSGRQHPLEDFLLICLFLLLPAMQPLKSLSWWLCTLSLGRPSRSSIDSTTSLRKSLKNGRTWWGFFYSDTINDAISWFSHTSSVVAFASIWPVMSTLAAERWWPVLCPLHRMWCSSEIFMPAVPIWLELTRKRSDCSPAQSSTGWSETKWTPPSLTRPAVLMTGVWRGCRGRDVA